MMPLSDSICIKVSPAVIETVNTDPVFANFLKEAILCFPADIRIFTDQMCLSALDPRINLTCFFPSDSFVLDIRKPFHSSFCIFYNAYLECKAFIDEEIVPYDYPVSEIKIMPPTLTTQRIDLTEVYYSSFIMKPPGLSYDKKRLIRMKKGEPVFPWPFRSTRNEKLPIINVVVRFVNGSSLELLKRSLMSLACQERVNVRPILVIRDPDEETLSQIHKICSGFIWSNGCNPVLNFLYSEDTKKDLRSEALKRGITSALEVSGPGEWLAFLDYDDVMFPFAYFSLVDRCLSKNYEMGFGRVFVTTGTHNDYYVANRKSNYFGGTCFEELMERNFVPIHSYVVSLDVFNRFKILIPNMKFLEDYYMLLQIVHYACVDWSGLTEELYVGDYWYGTDAARGTLSNLNFQTPPELNNEYRICEKSINELKIALNHKNVKKS